MTRYSFLEIKMLQLYDIVNYIKCAYLAICSSSENYAGAKTTRT